MEIKGIGPSVKPYHPLEIARGNRRGDHCRRTPKGGQESNWGKLYMQALITPDPEKRVRCLEGPAVKA